MAEEHSINQESKVEVEKKRLRKCLKCATLYISLISAVLILIAAICGLIGVNKFNTNITSLNSIVTQITQMGDNYGIINVFANNKQISTGKNIENEINQKLSEIKTTYMISNLSVQLNVKNINLAYNEATNKIIKGDYSGSIKLLIAILSEETLSSENRDKVYARLGQVMVLMSVKNGVPQNPAQPDICKDSDKCTDEDCESSDDECCSCSE